MKNLSFIVNGKTFGAILGVIAIAVGFLIFPEGNGNAFQASILGDNTIQEFLSDKLPVIHNLIKFVLFILVTSGLSLLVMSMLLKMEAKRHKNEVNLNGNVWDMMSSIPSVAIVETLVFVWVLGCLALSVLLLVDIFGGNMDLLMEASKTTPEILFRFSLIFGLLGGSLASIKFFIPSNKEIKTFHVGYVFKYIANPFFSSAIAFLSYLLFMNLQWFGLDKYTEQEANVLSLIFIFTLVGYFSENFIALLYALVKKVVEWAESSFSLQMNKKL